jgi:hypothetical protein
MNVRIDQVQEIQGLYGPFTVAERVLQKAWLRRYFSPGTLYLKSGKVLEVLHPGRWNHQEGPDFIGARLRVDGREVNGDVEVHFSPQDWRDHGHANDPAFRSVVLHVVFFDEVKAGAPIVTIAGVSPETFVLGRFMREDLETFAQEDALLEMEVRDSIPWAAAFLQLPLAQRAQRLHELACQRWRQKVAFAGVRLEKFGWREACHSAALEVLGYRRNRAPMASIATQHPLAKWQQEPPEPAVLLADADLWWRLSGLRPANPPLRRLQAYNNFVASHSDWPEAFAELLKEYVQAGSGESLPADSLISSGRVRKQLRLSALRKALQQYFKGLAGSSRLDTMMVDAILPLWSAEQVNLSLENYWLHWPVGDVPPSCRDFVMEAFAGEASVPVINNGLIQGALQLYFEG